MKKIVFTYSLSMLVFVNVNSQSNDWTKDDRNNVYNECLSYISKYQNLTTEQRESICICYLDEITKKYSKKEYQNKIDIELKKIRETTLTLCLKNLGIDVSETKQDIESKKDVNTSLPTKEMLIGHWKDENSEFWLFETGDYKMQYFDGDIVKGTWRIEGDQLSLYKEKLFGTSEKVYKILLFTNDKFVYQSIKNKKDTFTATRVK
jgi:ABC-type bacteriocin/lantibiotic exporter with double-glycine peptidase domain